MAPLIPKLAEGCPTAANTNECLLCRPIALTLRMSVSIDIKGDGGSPTLTTSRMSDYFADAGSTFRQGRLLRRDESLTHFSAQGFQQKIQLINVQTVININNGRYAPLGFQKSLKPRNTLYTLPSEPQPDRKRI